MTYCWVMVEAPWVWPPFAMLTTARSMPLGSMPLSVRKVSFSAAMTAFWRLGEMSVSSTICRLVSPLRTISVLSAQ